MLPAVSKDHNIPVFTFFLDEQTGKAGMNTRLEAFVDLMKRKKLKYGYLPEPLVNKFSNPRK